MTRALISGLVYFVLVFAAGFLLGTLRIMVLAPLLGGTGAVLVELPVMLALSWLACGFVVRRVGVDPGLAPRILMGVAAFALLMAAELGVSLLLLGRTAGDHLARYGEAEAALGLAGQIAFAAFPLLRRG